MRSRAICCRVSFMSEKELGEVICLWMNRLEVLFVACGSGKAKAATNHSTCQSSRQTRSVDSYASRPGQHSPFSFCPATHPCNARHIILHTAQASRVRVEVKGANHVTGEAAGQRAIQSSCSCQLLYL